MNKAKLVNSVLTGGGIGSHQHLNVVIGNEDKGFPRGHVLDANATLQLVGTSGAGTPGTGGGTGTNPGSQNTQSELEKIIKIDSHLGADQQRVKDLVIQSQFDDILSNIVLQSGYKSSDVSINRVVGGGSVIAGILNTSIGGYSIIAGSGVASKGYYNFVSGYSTQLNVVPNTENNNLRISVKSGSLVETFLKNGTYNITDQYAVKVVNGEDKIIKVYDAPVATRKSDNFTRINNNVIEMNNPYLNKLKDYDRVIVYAVELQGDSSIVSGRGIKCHSSYSLFVGRMLNSANDSNDRGPDGVACLGVGNTVSNYGELACGRFNTSLKGKDGEDGFKYSTMFSVGGGVLNSSNLNIIECILRRKEENGNVEKTEEVYIKGIGGYDGTNATSTQSKSLRQVISDIETAVQLNSNGPWDIDITSEFVNGNVTIKPLSMWYISQGIKRVYFTANLKQGDVITIPNTLRMYIGWKKAENRFGMADWATAGKKYTVTEDSYYVILIATENDNPGVQTNTLPSYGRVMLRTSNPEFKPTAKTDAKKDHTNDDKIMRSIAHQGFHKMERPNSLAAFRAAAKEGWRYVETDTYMTKDGKFIVSHDDNVPVGYTNGTVTLTDKTYKYGDHTLADILAFHGPNGEKVDTLEEFCKTCKECGLHPYIEIKQGMMWEANTIDTTNERYNGKPYAIKLLDIVNRYGLRGNATFISSTPYTLRLMAQQDQSYRYGIVYFGQIGVTIQDWTTVLSKIEEFNNDANASKAYLFIDVNIDNLKTADANFANWLVLRNCALEVWTAKTKEDVSNLDPYITGVTCDNIHAGEILAKDI